MMPMPMSALAYDVASCTHTPAETSLYLHNPCAARPCLYIRQSIRSGKCCNASFENILLTLLHFRRAPSVDCIMMSTKCNGHARYSGSSNCCPQRSISIVRAIESYDVATQFRADNCWPTNGVSSACASSSCPTVAATWSSPISATIAAEAVTQHRIVAPYTNTACRVACIRTSNHCWSRYSRHWIHKNTYTPAWSIISSCAWSSAALTRIRSNTRTNTATKRLNIAMAPPRRTNRSLQWHPRAVE